MRIKRAVNKNKNKTKVLKAAKGYWGARSKQYRYATEAVMKAQKYAYIGRKLRKRDMRTLWITRISAEAKNNGLSYNQFIHGLKVAEINLNRKILAEMAVNNKAEFASLAETAKKQIAKA